MERQQVYKIIDGERDYQDRKWGGRTHDDKKSVGDFIVYMDQYLFRAKEYLTKNPNKTYAMDAIRKLTALGIAAMETHGALTRYEQELLENKAFILE